jgi:hypothetical protein
MREPVVRRCRTTIDRRGPARRCAIDVAAATAGIGVGFVAGQSHHPPMAMLSAGAAVAATASAGWLRDRHARCRQIYADAQPDAPLVEHLGLAVEHRALHLRGAAHRIDDAGKFRQQPVAGGLTMRP